MSATAKATCRPGKPGPKSRRQENHEHHQALEDRAQGDDTGNYDGRAVRQGIHRENPLGGRSTHIRNHGGRDGDQDKAKADQPERNKGAPIHKRPHGGHPILPPRMP